LNCSKTEIILIENIPRRLKCHPDWVVDSFIIVGVEVEPSKSIRYLGVMIDNRLNFKDHVEYNYIIKSAR